MDADRLQKATAQAKTGWLEVALAELLPSVWDLSSDTENWQTTAIAWAETIDRLFEAQKLITPEQQKNRRTDIANALRIIHPEHPAIPYVLLPAQVYTQMNNQQASRLNARGNKLFTSQQANQLVDRAIALLDSSNPDEVAAGLAVLVGRRISELLISQFNPKTAYSLLFSEAVKRRGAMGLEFEIPTLAAADRILQAIADLKRVWSIAELQALHLPDNHLKRRINAKYSGVPEVCRRCFADLVPGREADTDAGERLYTHLFRAIYAEIATYYYKPDWVPDHRFKAEIQGHFKLTDTGEKIPNYSARQNYDDYLIRDRSPGQAGVKLGLPGVEILAVFQTEASMAKVKTAEQAKSTPATTKADIEPPVLNPCLGQGTINALRYRAVDRLLSANQWAEVATGLLLLTGRTCETLLSTLPTACTEFSIQVGDSEIPTLTLARQVISAWNKLHQLPSPPASQIPAAIQAVCQPTFQDLAPIDGIPELRSVYSRIVIHWFCPPGVEENDFLAAIQAAPPLAFQTANPNKGVKLGQRNVQVLKLFQTQPASQPDLARMPEDRLPDPTLPDLTSKDSLQPDDSPISDNSFALTHSPDVDTMTPEPTPPRSRPRRKTLSVDAELLRGVAALYGIEIRGRGGAGGLSYEVALHHLLSHLAEQGHPPSSASPAPVSSAPLDVTTTQAIADQARTLTWLTGRLEALEAEMVTLRQERDQAVAKLEQTPLQSSQLAQLQQENARLRQERDQASHKLNAFRTLLNGNGQNQSDDLGQSTPLTPLQPLTPVIAPPPSALTSRRVALVTLDQGLESPFPQPSRRRLSEDQALDNIRHAVRAIMQYNDDSDRSFDQKWYISFPAVQTLLREHGLSANQKNVATVFDELKTELEQHHDHHHIQSRHNRRHPDLTKIAQVISLDA